MESFNMTALPAQWKWLEQEPGPKVVKEFLKIYGVREIPGQQSNPLIMSWAKELGSKVGINYKNDDEAWCGIEAGIIALRAGFGSEVPEICVRASSWDKFGNEALVPMLGDFLRFEREGGGHIGIYLAEDDPRLNLERPCFYVGGGNQGNASAIVPIEKRRLKQARRCPWKIKQPDNVRRIFVNKSGTISTNER